MFPSCILPLSILLSPHPYALSLWRLNPFPFAPSTFSQSSSSLSSVSTPQPNSNSNSQRPHQTLKPTQTPIPNRKSDRNSNPNYPLPKPFQQSPTKNSDEKQAPPGESPR
ncbi:hypothetical protein F5Y03DRAFT_368850 [Xylaria venustula]|nr:hypothetical protein F5Y03DRAFT_368850 [Xylaria venustula]